MESTEEDCLRLHAHLLTNYRVSCSCIVAFDLLAKFGVNRLNLVVFYFSRVALVVLEFFRQIQMSLGLLSLFDQYT